MAMPSTSGNPDYFKYSIFQVKSKAPLCAGKRDKAAATSEVFGPVNTLATTLRNKLDRAIMDARDGAEAGARAALEACAVHHHKPYGHMSPEQRKLRNHLRARARQLGDKQDRSGNLDITHLVRECAYEQWHRMLFARFLAENNLLIEPAHGVAISLDECEELAQEEGTDLWTLASRYAQKMLPQIFRPDDPILQVTFAPEHKMKLERLLAGLESEMFMASDSLGWVYQFWQGRRKKEVNESGNKIGADELPAVTQLFTEPYMVDFLIHNTLGAWHAGKVLKQELELASSAKSEQELRDAVSLPGISWEYLRFVRDGDNSPWRPAAGTFDGWPASAAEIKTLDPCCGSGHFIVALLRHLVPIRMAEEGLSARDAVDAVIKDNLHGLEIDERCTQIAAFAIGLSAWTYPGAEGFRQLPDMRIACCGVAPNAKKEEWLEIARLAADLITQVNEQELFPDPNKETMWHVQLKNGMEALYELFKQAPVLGSLIDPRNVRGDLFKADFVQLADLMHDALKKEQQDIGDDMHEMRVAAKGVADAVKLLAGRYHLVITNVPFLGRVKQNGMLVEFIDRFYRLARFDISTVFIQRCISLASTDCIVAAVTPQSWLFAKSYSAFRKDLLTTSSIRMIAQLGARAFETISGEIVNVNLNIFANMQIDRMIVGVDASIMDTPAEKQRALTCAATTIVAQKAQLKNPDYRISTERIDNVALLSKYAQGLHGQGTFDKGCFSFNFWEIASLAKGWVLQQTTALKEKNDYGATQVFRWENGTGLLLKLMELKKEDGYSSGKWRAGVSNWGKEGIAISGMGRICIAPYLGRSYDENVAVIVPFESKHLLPIWCFCCSEEFQNELKKIDRNLKASCNTLVKLPFNEPVWSEAASNCSIKNICEPYSDDPTQWVFHGNAFEATAPLQVIMARLLGYRWPAELNPDMRLSKKSRELVAKCEELLPLADQDGIVCIPSVRGEEIAVDRLRAMLAKAYGEAWSPKVEHDMLAASGGKAADLEDWLRNEFFEQHCKLFHHRPFIWHIWDGRKRDGFHALVNYHRLAAPNGGGRKLLENLTYSYLGDWITRQKDGVKNEEGGAEERLIAAEQLQNRLKAILHGEKPYDIFVRWKAIQQQAIGWDPDINDGVRMNIRPFMADDVPGGKKGAGVLRWKPNIKWSKDRGTEPRRKKEEYPWFWDGNEFTGDRVNDVHLTLEEKKTARGKAKQ